MFNDAVWCTLIFYLLFQAENEPEPECEPIEEPPPELLDNQTLENKEVRKENRIACVSWVVKEDSHLSFSFGQIWVNGIQLTFLNLKCQGQFTMLNII